MSCRVKRWSRYLGAVGVKVVGKRPVKASINDTKHAAKNVYSATQAEAPSTQTNKMLDYYEQNRCQICAIMVYNAQKSKNANELVP